MGIFDKFKNKKDDDLADEKVVVSPSVNSVAPKTKTVSKVKSEKTEEIKSEVSEVKEQTTVSKTKTGENLFGVLVRPIVTEKSSMLGQLNQYAFLVSTNANKIQVAKAVKEKYGVEPVRVNILNKSGRRVRYGKTYGKTSDTRKAIVFLPEGKSITIYEGV
ncbi:MAG: 50S ribosomal protein L23 [Patescibacteria group bacterium]|jgi:large subunit ribosomal protein L23